MNLELNKLMLTKLVKDQDESIAEYEEFYRSLIEYNEETVREELEKFELKQATYNKTTKYLKALIEDQEKALLDFEEIQKKEKIRKSNYARARIPFIQNQISNYDPTKVRDKSSIMYSSYVTGHAHYVSQLAQLTADLFI